jgi:biopolymer transport protein ExbD
MPITRARLQISEYNKKRKVRVTKQERRILMASLSLTSMVDMFAIMVIFLLANSSTVAQWIEVAHSIELPQAKFANPPPRAATLQISRDAVYGDTKMLIPIAQVRGDGSIDVLKNWLAKQARKEGFVNIVAHHRTPYGVIKRVIATCQDAGFKNVNLAVQPKASQ